MSYNTSNGVYVDAQSLDLSPAAFTAAGTTTGNVVELGRRRAVTLTLATSAVSASDTLDVIQSSQDGTTWYTAGTFAQQGTPSSETKTFICGRFMRPQFVVAGSGIAITATLVGEAA